MWKELYGLSSWGWDKDKGVPVASKEVMETYFEANPAAEKFCDTPPAFLDLMQELFNGVLVIGGYVRSINKAIKRSMDPKLLSIAAS